MKHRSNNDVGVNDAQIKGWLVLLHEFPCYGLGASLGDIVTENGVAPLNCLLSCDLKLCQNTFFQRNLGYTYRIPVFLCVGLPLFGGVFERVQYRHSTAKQDKALQRRATVGFCSFQDLRSSDHVRF